MEKLEKKMLTEGIKNLDALEKFGRSLARKEEGYDHESSRGTRPKIAMSSSQVRRFFGALKRIQADFDNLKGEILLLEPKLAYAVGREDKNKTSKLVDFFNALSPLLKDINEDEKKFKNFVNIVEVIVAYHKAEEVIKSR